MSDARAKRRRQRRQEQLEAADFVKVSGFAVKTHMVAGASIGSVAALVLAYMLWLENSCVFTTADLVLGPKSRNVAPNCRVMMRTPQRS